MVDAHCHLNFHKFDEDYDAIIKDALEAGVTTIVNTGTSIPSSRQALELAQKYENLYAIVGIHPHHVEDPEQREGLQKSSKEIPKQVRDNNYQWLQTLEQLAKQPKVIGIGECGMDYYSYKSNGIVDKKLQEDAFRRQIELSIKLGLPLQIHNRLAWDDTLGILLEYKNQLQDPPGMFHCFSGSIEFTKKVLDAEFYLGFDGNITYPGIAPGETTALVDLVKYAPIDRLLVETDSPFLSPQLFRGTRNVPANAIHIARFIASVKSIDYNTVEEATLLNTHRVFKISTSAV